MEKRDTVAFLAYRLRSQTLSNKEKVTFDRVWTNVGNGYKPSTVIFKAPQPGHYHLTVVVMSTEGNILSLYLCHNGLRITSSFLTGIIRQEHKVHIESSSSYTILISSRQFVTFSGYRIT